MSNGTSCMPHNLRCTTTVIATAVGEAVVVTLFGIVICSLNLRRFGAYIRTSRPEAEQVGGVIMTLCQKGST